METIILFILALFPTLILGYVIYEKDIIEKEPIGLLILLFVSGIAIIYPAMLLEQGIANVLTKVSMIFNIENFEILTILEAFLEIALVEEGLKWLVVYNVTYRNKNFNHIYDGIVYAVFVSLGFATLENILYVVNGGVYVAILRGICSVPGHAFDGVVSGYFLGLAKYYGANKERALQKNAIIEQENALYGANIETPNYGEYENLKSLEKKSKILSIIVPLILHGIFDFLLLMGQNNLLIIFFIFVAVLYLIGIKMIQRQSSVLSMI